MSDVPVYFADPLVRRSPPLQKTRDAAAPSARASAATLARLGFEAGARVRVKQGGAAELTVVVDENVADKCVRIAAAHPATAALGPMCGEISLERV